MKKKYLLLPLLLLNFGIVQHSNAQGKSMVNTSKSSHTRLYSVDMDGAKFTQGFWAERFQVCSQTMIPFMWDILNDAERSHSFRNFEIAAGLKEGVHDGPPFHDGDFYKWLEAAAAVYTITKDKELDSLMDYIITIIEKSQRADGYIHTPVNIEQRIHPEQKVEFAERMDFETYNLGHLMTAACIHHRGTGKTTLLNIAIKATDYLYNFYTKSSEELAGNAICPSHYMGVTEMYRTTQDLRYLELAENLIDIRSLVKDGEDHNQDRIPFREQTKAMGHAVRANYLYAGVADVILENGDSTLLEPLKLIWEDLVSNKLYITGGCGALYDGVSPDGTTYDQPSIQQIHQAYGRDYQLPNLTAHNESCANIGNVLWNWRMLQLTGEARYAELVEHTLYNGVLSAVSLDGKRFFYTNPLAVNNDLPYSLRWSKDREEYISHCNCCPPNVVRTVAEVSNYLYTTSKEGVWCHMYAGSELKCKLPNGSQVEFSQKTDYPWDGKVEITIQKAPKKQQFSFFLRIPSWADQSEILVNGNPTKGIIKKGEYAELNGTWKKGDVITLNLPMKTKLMAANPLVEETRNQVAVQRGPIVYCIESPDMPEGLRVFDFALSSQTDLNPVLTQIDGSSITVLEGELSLLPEQDWGSDLYKEINSTPLKKLTLQLIPYYAWNNRGKSEMSVWIPLRD